MSSRKQQICWAEDSQVGVWGSWATSKLRGEIPEKRRATEKGPKNLNINSPSNPWLTPELHMCSPAGGKKKRGEGEGKGKGRRKRKREKEREEEEKKKKKTVGKLKELSRDFSTSSVLGGRVWSLNSTKLEKTGNPSVVLLKL